MGIFSNLRQRITRHFQKWREVGEFQASFSSFGPNLYASDIVRSCVRPLADFTSKANARCSDPQLERLLNTRPNLYMSGKEFLSKVRTLYELKNNVFIYIERDERGKVKCLYPVPYQTLEAMEYANGLFICFHFSTGDQITISWEDLAVLRKDYNESNIVGDDNRALLQTLELISTTNQGIANAVKSTANLRGILKTTKAMLAEEDIRRNKENFVKDYLNLENEGGIASLDSTMDFTPITMSPVMTSWEQIKEFRENVYRYFGVNDKIVMSSMTPDEIEGFYELKIEPFLVDLSTELTAKIYGGGKQLAYNNWVVFEANKLQFSSLAKKIQMFQVVVQYGGMTVNEWRAGCNMAPIEGGDELIRRLDAAPVANEGKEEEKDEE